ncbi:MAG: class IV adenylate cyclase [Candidatus Kerfeldbacteria bacterium]
MEIEIKAQVKNFTEVKKNLKKIGAKYIGKKNQIDYYYSLYKRSIGKKRGSVMRVRHDRIIGETRLEFHKPKNIYAAEEIELEVHSLPIVKRILKEMKAKQEFVIDKERLVYRKGKIEIVLDTIKALGTFVEVEIEGRDTKKNRKLLYKMLDQLGIEKSQILLHERYHGMILKKRGIMHAYF